jgi:F-type H+-transporting ATPase subunit b
MIERKIDMPQLDHITFASQMLWLVILFFSFYIVTLYFILPTISQILKVRVKKLTSGNNQLSVFHDEESTVKKEYDLLLMDSLTQSKNLLMKTADQSIEWVKDSTKHVNETMLLNMNKKYIEIVGDLKGKTYIIKNCISQ